MFSDLERIHDSGIHQSICMTGCFNRSMKIQKRIEWAGILLSVALGLLCILLPVQMAGVLPYIAAVIGLAGGIFFGIHGFKKHRGVDLIASGCLLVLALICVLSRHYGNALLIAAFSIYYTACSIVLLIQMGLDLSRKGKDWIAELIMGLLYGILGVGSIALMRTDLVIVQWILGGACLLQGIQMLLEMVFFSNKYNARYYSFRSWICLPAFMVGTLPAIIYMLFMGKKMRTRPDVFDYKKTDEPADLSVFIHTGTYASKLYGHMTFSRNGVAYSYGDYDYDAEKFFHFIGPGTFFTVGSEIYSNNCCIVENSPQFEYGIRLSQKQKEKFDTVIQDILDHTESWQCELEQMPYEEAEEQFSKYEHTYADRLWWRTGCQFRQYHEGDWAWYSLLGNNCSNFAAAKLNEIGLEIPVAKGIVSPGEFFQYFEEALQDPDSPVISRSWHSAAAPETLYDVID